jgi:hypothetical protein
LVGPFFGSGLVDCYDPRHLVYIVVSRYNVYRSSLLIGPKSGWAVDPSQYEIAFEWGVFGIAPEFEPILQNRSHVSGREHFCSALLFSVVSIEDTVVHQ